MQHFKQRRRDARGIKTVFVIISAELDRVVLLRYSVVLAWAGGWGCPRNLVNDIRGVFVKDTAPIWIYACGEETILIWLALTRVADASHLEGDVTARRRYFPTLSICRDVLRGYLGFYHKTIFKPLGVISGGTDWSRILLCICRTLLYHKPSDG